MCIRFPYLFCLTSHGKHQLQPPNPAGAQGNSDMTMSWRWILWIVSHTAIEDSINPLQFHLQIHTRTYKNYNNHQRWKRWILLSNPLLAVLWQKNIEAWSSRNAKTPTSLDPRTARPGAFLGPKPRTEAIRPPFKASNHWKNHPSVHYASPKEA